VPAAASGGGSLCPQPVSTRAPRLGRRRAPDTSANGGIAESAACRRKPAAPIAPRADGDRGRGGSNPGSGASLFRGGIAPCVLRCVRGGVSRRAGVPRCRGVLRRRAVVAPAGCLRAARPSRAGRCSGDQRSSSRCRTRCSMGTPARTPTMTSPTPVSAIARSIALRSPGAPGSSPTGSSAWTRAWRTSAAAPRTSGSPGRTPIRSSPSTWGP